MNPILAPSMTGGNPAEQDLNSLIFEGLTALSEDGQISPSLATEWELSEDGLEYLFRLRDVVTWHDSAPFTAADVAFTVQAMQDPDYQGDANLSDLWRNVVVEQVDDYAVRFRLAEPFPSFLYYTTVGLLPAHRLGNVPAATLPSSSFSRRAPIGTGRFKVESAVPDRVVLVAIGESHPTWSAWNSGSMTTGRGCSPTLSGERFKVSTLPRASPFPRWPARPTCSSIRPRRRATASSF